MLWTYSQFPEIPCNYSGSERLKALFCLEEPFKAIKLWAKIPPRMKYRLYMLRPVLSCILHRPLPVTLLRVYHWASMSRFLWELNYTSGSAPLCTIVLSIKWWLAFLTDCFGITMFITPFASAFPFSLVWIYIWIIFGYISARDPWMSAVMWPPLSSKYLDMAACEYNNILWKWLHQSILNHYTCIWYRACQAGHHPVPMAEKSMQCNLKTNLVQSILFLLCY